MAELQPLTLNQTRKILEDLGHHPKRSLGQNFLIDANIVRKSLDLADLQRGDTSIEIGPGLGTLTRGLLQAEATVFAIEQDPVLSEFLRRSLGDHPRFHLAEGDACKSPLAGFEPDEGQAYKIVANLPYAISSPWMEAVLQTQTLPERIVILVQKEMADRMTAEPGGKNIGALTLFLESCFERLPGHTVSSSCFVPVPKVDSVLFHLKRKARPAPYCRAAREAVRAMFTQRRKQIGSLAKKQLPVRVAKDWFDFLESPTLRPEQISFQQWQQLNRLLKKTG